MMKKVNHVKEVTPNTVKSLMKQNLGLKWNRGHFVHIVHSYLLSNCLTRVYKVKDRLTIGEVRLTL